MMTREIESKMALGGIDNNSDSSRLAGRARYHAAPLHGVAGGLATRGAVRLWVGRASPCALGWVDGPSAHPSNGGHYITPADFATVEFKRVDRGKYVVAAAIGGVVGRDGYRRTGSSEPATSDAIDVILRSKLGANVSKMCGLFPKPVRKTIARPVPPNR
jgi:hypothetical protein